MYPCIQKMASAVWLPTRVCVVGAGAAGLCCARHLLDKRHANENNYFSCTIFEQSSCIGGTWTYTENSFSSNNGNSLTHSSMYKNLRTNLPKEVMAFPDFPFKEIESSFIHHSQVKAYLENYANHFKLYQHIKFNSIITLIQPKYCNLEKTAWNVTVKDTFSNDERIYEFDSVMVCNGHYSTPNIPIIPGIEDFSGTKLHSHDYREPSTFTGQIVAILGASASGLDIAVDLSTVAKQIYLCHNLPEKIQSKLPSNVIEMAGITSYSINDGFLLSNKEQIKADTLMYCTGYEYSFPFLDPKCEIQIVDNRVIDLYQHMINIKHPTMCFIGLPFIVVPFVVVHYQVLFFISTMKSNSLLPCRQEMLRHTEQDYQIRQKLKMPWKYAHKFGALQWDYIDQISLLSQAEKLPPVVQKMYEHVSAFRKKDLLNYRNFNYKMLSDKDFICN